MNSNKDKKRYFQWISGNDIGKITTLSTMYKVDDEIFMEFDDGECCNIRYVASMTNDVNDLNEKFIVELYDPSYAWEVEKIESKKYKDETTNEFFDIPTLEDVLQANGNSCNIANSSLGKTKLKVGNICPFKLELPSLEDYEKSTVADNLDITEDLNNLTDSICASDVTKTHEEPTIEKVQQPIQQQENLTDPVFILSKTCKKHPTEVSINLTIDLPNKSIFNMVSEEFENGSDLFIDYIVNSIDMSVFSKALKDALIASYTETSEK